jgi:YrbI family 3-deoxy-D-manno-octulosonate 8-phosphate phosphatase
MNMSLSRTPLIENIDAFVFDFDGVLTNNLVCIDSIGKESVTCSRADGLAFDVLRKLNIPAYILSTEKNLVVSERAKKLKIEAIQSISNKSETLIELVKVKQFDLSRIFYVGNDVNDFNAMKACGYSACPQDSHIKIKQIASSILSSNGGDGVVREILEDLLQLDFIEILYS